MFVSGVLADLPASLWAFLINQVEQREIDGELQNGDGRHFQAFSQETYHSFLIILGITFVRLICNSNIQRIRLLVLFNTCSIVELDAAFQTC